MTRLLENKSALITGASGGIGRAAALLFAQHGAALVLNGRNQAELDETLAQVLAFGVRAQAVTGDIRDANTHDVLVAKALGHGGLHIAFNNAGEVGATAPLADVTQATWDSVIGSNLTGAFLAARAQIPAMLDTGGGTLIFTSSFVGSSIGIAGMSAYGAAKAGIMGLVKGITADYGAQGIRANAIMAGGTDTKAGGNAEQKAWAASLHAMKRIAEPAEIAQAALFLASDMSSFVSGSPLWADGGNAAVK